MIHTSWRRSRSARPPSCCTAHAQSKIACDPDNGGITLPQGFCALVVADDLGAARHMAVAPNGDLYVATQTPRRRADGRRPAAASSRCATRNGDGKFDMHEQFGEGSTTGIALRNGYLYLAQPQDDRALQDDARAAEAGRRRRSRSSTDLPPDRRSTTTRASRSTAAARSTSTSARRRNACQNPRSPPGVEGPGSVPDPREARRHLEVRREQAGSDSRRTATRFATGLRQMPAITWHDGALYIAMNNRDQLDTFWPELFTAEDNAERPAEPMYRATCRDRTSAGRTASSTTGRRSWC